MSTIKQFATIIPVLEDFKHMENDTIFFSPIDVGKWSSAAIVAHLIFWDEYILRTRLPIMVKLDTLPSSQVDVNAMNKDAETFAHSGISKIELIDQFIYTRKQLIEELEKVDLQKAFKIGDRYFSIEKYLLGLIEHDNHHLEQIKAVYNRNF
jgi:DinB superfamily